MLLNHNYLTSVFTTLFLQFLQVPGRGHSVYYTFYCYLLMGYEVGVPDHLTCLLRNLYAGQEGTGSTGHGTRDWFQIGKGVRQGCILSPCLFNLYAEYIMRNPGLDEAQAGIKIARRNINNLRKADDITLWQKAKKNKRAS